MKILLIGSGGREHALGLRLLQDPGIHQVLVYPGNPGMKSTEGLFPIPSAKISFEVALTIALKENVSLVVIGPEWPLYQGWVDQFEKEKIPVFGPSKAASVLEESKISAKIFMKENQIPTARFQVAKTLEETISIIKSNPDWAGYVLKLSGPALGKGVVVTQTSSEAIHAAQDFFSYSPLGIEDGVVVEELIQGKEVSLFYVCLGEDYHYLTSACDHKRLLDHDQGPNTGGMGAYSPANWVSTELLKKAEDQFLKPTLLAMKNNGTPFKGVLFIGLMIADQNPYLLEYNVRFGDPETQAILPRIQGNLSALLLACAQKNEEEFRKIQLRESSLHSLHIVKAAKGYPGIHGEPIETGKVIKFNLKPSLHEQFYFAGVSEKDNQLWSSGGRVLGFTTLADSIVEVQKNAYEKLAQVSFDGEQFRTDIGVNR